MKEIKTREHNHTPRVLSDVARAPKELAKRSIIQAKTNAREAAQRPESQQADSPDRYAENRVEQTAEVMAHRAVEGGKNTVRKANDIRRHITEIRKERKSSQTNSYKAGRERVVRSSQRSAAKQATANTRNAAKTTKATTKGVVKTAKHTVKTADKTVKTAQKSVKTATKTAQKAAQATAKAAQAAAKAAQAAARAAAAAAKAAAKAIAAIIKAIIAAVKALIAAIAAGGWVAVVIIIVVVLVVALLAVFGVFSSNEVPDGSKPLTAAIEAIDGRYRQDMKNTITEFTAQADADAVELIFEGDMESLDGTVTNWADVVGVYAAKLSMDTENPQDVTVVSEENIAQLEAIFRDMNSISYRTETERREHL